MIVCPHCWSHFPPERVLAISSAADLLGDFRLGSAEQTRFLPERFDVSGVPKDQMGYSCSKKACPNCHLLVPDVMMTTPSQIISIVGAPASGKSYFLASMTYKLRTTLPNVFGLSFSDSDVNMNHRLREYETQQFENENAQQWVTIKKTEVEGEGYDFVKFGNQQIKYPQPFVFTVRLVPKHPLYNPEQIITTSLCLYDNAGESYLSTEDRVEAPVTQHLKHCQSIFFMYDPMQSLRFRNACREVSNDPQLDSNNLRSNIRQDAIFHEMAHRFRTLRQLGESQQSQIPLVVIVTKYDIWHKLLGNSPLELPAPWAKLSSMKYAGLNLKAVESISNVIRNLLLKIDPSFPNIAEEFSSNVLFVPVSATGCAPVPGKEGGLGFRPGDLKPIWTEVPLLYYLCSKGVIPGVGKVDKANNTGSAANAGTANASKQG